MCCRMRYIGAYVRAACQCRLLWQAMGPVSASEAAMCPGLSHGVYHPVLQTCDSARMLAHPTPHTPTHLPHASCRCSSGTGGPGAPLVHSTTDLEVASRLATLNAALRRMPKRQREQQQQQVGSGGMML